MSVVKTAGTTAAPGSSGLLTSGENISLSPRAIANSAASAVYVTASSAGPGDVQLVGTTPALVTTKSESVKSILTSFILPALAPSLVTVTSRMTLVAPATADAPSAKSMSAVDVWVAATGTAITKLRLKASTSAMATRPIELNLRFIILYVSS
ncbi:hypothetical protein ES703_56701 [subsurface metagenome]